MATARRIPQDGKTVQDVKTDYLSYVLTEEKNGVPVPGSRTVIGSEAVARPVRVNVPQPDRILMDLSLDEAVTLAIILRHVGGYPTGRWRDAAAMRQALRAIGVDIDAAGLRPHPDFDLTRAHYLNFRPGRTNTYVRTSPIQGVRAAQVSAETDKGLTADQGSAAPSNCTPTSPSRF